MQSESLDVLLDEQKLNTHITRAVFKNFTLSTIGFAVGMISYAAVALPYNLFVHMNIWSFFLLQTILFALTRITFRGEKMYIPLIITSVTMGLISMPIIHYFRLEFGIAMIHKSVLVSLLLFSGLALIGWHKKNLITGVVHHARFGFLLLLFFSVIAPFINWTNFYEMLFAAAAVAFIGLMTLFDYQKMNFYPKRAVVSLSIQLFANLTTILIFVLRLISSFYRV